MLFWLFGCSAVVVLLALGMIVIGLVVWLIWRPLGWWDRPERPYGFHEWFQSLPKEKQAEFKAWERRKAQYVKARERQWLLAERIWREGGYRDDRKHGWFAAWVKADLALGLTDGFGDVIDAKDCPPCRNELQCPSRPDPRPPARPSGVGLPPGWTE